MPLRYQILSQGMAVVLQALACIGSLMLTQEPDDTSCDKSAFSTFVRRFRVSDLT